jgi:hypothetical protein
MKRSRTIKAVWLVMGLMLIFSLLFANQIINKPASQITGDTVNSDTLLSATAPSVLRQPTFTAVTLTYYTLTAAAAMPSVTPPPSVTPLPPSAISSLQPPQCTFPLAQTTDAEPMSEKYTFSEPQVVLTDELQPDIVGWLPDNQNVLIMRLKLIDLGMNGYQQTIELFNPETKEVQVYATRRKVEGAPPAWNPALNAIVYADMNVLEGSTITDFKFTRQVKISYGNPDDVQILADNLPQYYVAVKSDGSQTAYLIDKQLFRLDAALKPLAPVSFDGKRGNYLHENIDSSVVNYKMAWRPNSPQIFLYNHAVDGLGYTYVLDTDSGQLCNLNFGGWALTTRWSPNGRYLAIIRAQGRAPLESADVVILDTATGEYYALGVIDAQMKGGHYVQDIVWGPDNRHLLFLIETTYSPSTYSYGGLLYLVDFVSGQADRIFSLHQLNIYAGGTNLAWSPDGSKVLMNCPSSEGAKQVCLISVQTLSE